MKFNANQFPEVYQKLGLSVRDLGCIMLDLEPIDIIGSYGLDEEDLFYSSTQDFVQGVVAEKHAHITLLYGLLDPGTKMKPHVDTVLKDWKRPKTVTVDHVGFFPSPIQGEDYSAIIAHIEVNEALQEAHSRLSLLPHINTFPEYRAHATLAYVKAEATQEWVEELNVLAGRTLTTKADLNYGG